jgi:hypothetical protein
LSTNHSVLRREFWAMCAFFRSAGYLTMLSERHPGNYCSLALVPAFYYQGAN